MTGTYDDQDSGEVTADITSVCHPDYLKNEDRPAVGVEKTHSRRANRPSGSALHVVKGGLDTASRSPQDQLATSASRADDVRRRTIQTNSRPDRYRSPRIRSVAQHDGGAAEVADSPIVGAADAEPAGAQRDGLHDESQPLRLLDALLGGRRFDRWSLWELADHLRLPSTGSFIVIAAELPQAGGEALPGIESKLRSLDIYSAWRLSPELQVGIVALRTDKDRNKALALVSRMAATRVGVSGCFDDLGDTSQALQCARITLRGRTEPGRLVSVFDASVLAGAAVSAPEVMTKLVAPMLARFRELADDEQETLLETFWAWAETGGSPRAAAELLFCHPNTVRYRLRRIEQRTGRSLSRPRDIAELCLAFEVHRRLL